MTAATAAYLTEEDTFGAWLDECVRKGGEDASESSAALFASWESYAQRAHEPAGSRKAFSRSLLARGFAPSRIGHGGTKGFKGLRLAAATGVPSSEDRSASVNSPMPEPSAQATARH